MNRQGKTRLLVFLSVLASAVLLTGSQAKDPADVPEKKPGADKNPMPTWATTVVKPKDLSEQVNKGLEYLIGQQKENGGWGQGGGWRTGTQGGGRIEGPDVQDPPDVANTCMATLALLRAGHTPKEGKYAKNVLKAIDFICNHIEKSDKKSIYITDLRGTQVQTKIGPYVDTFMASLVLSEVKGRMPDEKSEKRMIAALNKTIGKIEDNIKADGSFAGNDGWAACLSQGLCSKSLNRARQAGAQVSDETLARAERQSSLGLDKKTGRFASAGEITAGASSAAAAPSDAGVGIYNSSSKNSGLQDAVNTNRLREKEARKILADKNAAKEAKDKAKKDLEYFAKVEEANEAATQGLIKQLDNKQFIAGFGSNGGEEFLSYMNVSETLLVKGGDEWKKWDKQVSDNLNRIQNKDGSWAGQHCITGRTFCTASAMLVLLADRAPVPVAAKTK